MPIADVTVQLVSGSTKDAAIITESVVTSAPKGICLGFSGVNNARGVEIVQGLKLLRDKFIEGGQLADPSSQLGSMLIGSTKDNAIITAPATEPALGTLFIIVDENYAVKGDEIFHSDVATAIRALTDNYLKGV